MPAHDHAAEIDGVESEADRINQYSVSWFMKGTAQLRPIETSPVRSLTTSFL